MVEAIAQPGDRRAAPRGRGSKDRSAESGAEAHPSVDLVGRAQHRRADADVDGRADRRVRRAVLGAQHLRAQTGVPAPATAGGATGLRARPELHVGAADLRAPADGNRHHHDDHHNHQPTETTTASPGETTSPTSPTDQRRPQRWFPGRWDRMTITQTPTPTQPPAPSSRRRGRRPRPAPGAGTGADDAGSAE